MVRRALGSMPDTLEETYDRILDAVPLRHLPLVQSAIHWLAFAARPLLVEELAEAVVIQPETGSFDPESCRLLDPTLVLDLCGVLVTTSDVPVKDTGFEWLAEKLYTENKTSTPLYMRYSGTEYTMISLSHYSVKEYISSKRLQDSRLSGFYTSGYLAHSFLAQCCLLYLLDFNSGEIASEPDFEENPLLEYSARNWIQHWKQGTLCDDNLTLRRFVEKLLNPARSVAC